MAKEIKFNFKLNVDGKGQLVSATTTVDNLRGTVNVAKTDIQKANAIFVNFNQQVMKFQNVVYLLIPTSNHNYAEVVSPKEFVVYLLIPTSNHNCHEARNLCRNVVYLLIPTSNHNCQ